MVLQYRRLLSSVLYYSLAAITDALVQEAAITSALVSLIENSTVSGMLEVCLNHHAPQHGIHTISLIVQYTVPVQCM